MKQKLKNTLIYLIGFPGTGKYTIAKEIIQQADVKLVDNHLINNPLFSIIQTQGVPRLPERIWDNVDKIWEAVLDTMVHISPAEYSFVLTNVLLNDDPGDLRLYNNIKSTAEQRNACFVPVKLTISDVEEHRKRITTEERRDRFKEVNPNSPEKYATRKQILEFEHPNKFILDVTQLPATEAAAKIIQHAITMQSSMEQQKAACSSGGIA